MRTSILQRILTNYIGREELRQMNAENIDSLAPSFLYLSGHLYLSQSPLPLHWIPCYHYPLCFRTFSDSLYSTPATFWYHLQPNELPRHFDLFCLCLCNPVYLVCLPFSLISFYSPYFIQLICHLFYSIYYKSSIEWCAFSKTLSTYSFHTCYISNHIISLGFTSNVCFLCTHTFNSSESGVLPYKLWYTPT